uniref:Radical SAM protein n=1 Tax=Ignisphaera aggregans TaxID=334771 RepID=A0A7C2ZRK0_9CREN
MNISKLHVVKPFDPWRSPLCTCPVKWVVHPYTGCSHGCLYCYATSYIPRHSIVRPKTNFLSRLAKDIPKLPRGALIELSSSSDPYPPVESRYCLTRNALRLLLTNGFRVLIVTKGSVVLRDIDLLTSYRDRVAVSITITTPSDRIASLIEPGAPPSSERLRVVERLAHSGVNVVVRLDPVIPYINDDYEELRRLVKMVSNAGAKQITTSTLKARADSIKRLCIAFPHIKDRLLELYSKDMSEYIHGYRYLRRGIRFYYMKMLKELVEEEGLVFGTCREGFPYLNTPGFSCDGSTFTLEG